MSDIAKLMKLCKAGITIMVNDHRICYKRAIDELRDVHSDEMKTMDIDVIKEIESRDSLVVIYAYPDTPIGSYKVIHYDIDEAIKKTIKIIEGNK